MKHDAIVYSRGARADIEDIADYIAARSSTAIAEQYIAGLIEECESLQTAPSRGTTRRDLRRSMRVIGYKRTASIVFRTEEAAGLVVILAVNYHGRSYKRVTKHDE